MQQWIDRTERVNHTQKVGFPTQRMLCPAAGLDLQSAKTF